MPLDVDKGIELPQLELISTKNDDCTTVYSTGNMRLSRSIRPSTCAYYHFDELLFSN